MVCVAWHAIAHLTNAPVPGNGAVHGWGWDWGSGGPTLSTPRALATRRHPVTGRARPVGSATGRGGGGVGVGGRKEIDKCA